MTHQLVVPKNKMGIFEYHNTFKEDNSLLINLSSDEYTQLCESGALDLMNEQCGILMDEYEEDTIEFKHLKECMDILKRTNCDNGSFAKALRMAYDLHTEVEVSL
jgi:hypothetical protein